MNKLKYINFCQEEPNIPLFSQPWWLDVVCGESWDVAIVEQSGEIIASMPYFKKKKYFFDVITMPPFTQHIGIWLKPVANLNQSEWLHFELETIKRLVAQLPKTNKFTQNFHHNFNYWLPFGWKKYKQRFLYTYILENIKNYDLIFQNFKKNIRKDIRKARNNGLRIKKTQDIETLIFLYEMTFEKQNLKIPYSSNIVRAIHQACLQKGTGCIFKAQDIYNQTLSTTFVVWDNNTAYALIGGLNSNFTDQGTNSLLFWEAIKAVSDFCDNFDFEGTILQNIEPFFASFNAKPTAYSQVYKKFRPFKS